MFFPAPATLNGDIINKAQFEAIQHAMKQLEVSLIYYISGPFSLMYTQVATKYHFYVSVNLGGSRVKLITWFVIDLGYKGSPPVQV
jgi:hypothetical protein